MIITVNNQNLEIEDNISIQELLIHLNTPEKGLAVAINNNIIPLAKWSVSILHKSDKLLLIRASQGG